MFQNPVSPPGATRDRAEWEGSGPRLRLSAIRTLRWRLALPYIVIIIVVMTILDISLAIAIRNEYRDQLSRNLGDQAELVARLTEPSIAAGGGRGSVDPIVRGLIGRIDTRVTVIGIDGTVLGETDVVATTMENHSTRPEFEDALLGETGESERYSTTGDERLLYVAVPIGEPPVGVARVAVPVARVDAAVWGLQRGFLIATTIAALLAMGVSLVAAGRISTSLERVRRQARAVAAGRLDVSVDPDSIREIGDLGRAFNSMTGDLRRLVGEIERSRIRLEAVLAALQDGVVITDAAGEVVRMNSAAGQMLRVEPAEVVGQPFVVVCRDHELAELLRLALALGTRRNAQIEFGLDRLMLEAWSQAVVGTHETLGLVVLRDVTELRRLEAIRKEFVANVSHELRTPLASIKALVETLEAGAIDDRPMAVDFLARIVGEVDRLAALVDELLDLARLESGRITLRLESLDPRDLIGRAAERLKPQTERARLDLEVEVDAGLPSVLADRARIEQVLLNLIHNAIKFTPVGGRIIVSGRVDEDMLLVSVRDTGVGIAEDEVPRIFERFYKADKARRSEGTGLGLAIAKHIVLAHGGTITVQSRRGEGTVFRFTLPLATNVAAPMVIPKARSFVRVPN